MIRKNFQTLLLLFSALSLGVFTSCDEEEETNGGVPFTFNSSSFTATLGSVTDYGPDGLAGTDTHYNYDFVIYDGTISESTLSVSGSFILYAELFSAGTAAFTPGTFTYMEPAMASEVESVNYFEYMDILVDGNGDNSLTYTADDLYFEATGGTVEVVDNGNNNYTLIFDVTMQQYDFSTFSYVTGSETPMSATITMDYQYVDAR